MGLDTLGSFPSFLITETIFVTSCLLPCINKSLLQGFILKGKNLLPVGANSFLLEQTPFQNRCK